jgi:hypothetical protein
MNQTESVLQLLSTLELASALFDPSDPKAGRKSIIIILRALNDFLIAVDAQKPSHAPLNELIYALADLDRGRVSPLLRKTKVKHRSKNSIADEFLRTFAAVAMDLMMQEKLPRKMAAKRVAGELTKMGYRHPTRGAIRAQHIEDWRDEISREGRRSERHMQFCRVREEAVTHRPDRPFDKAVFLLERLPAAFPPRAARNANSE